MPTVFILNVGMLDGILLRTVIMTVMFSFSIPSRLSVILIVSFAILSILIVVILCIKNTACHYAECHYVKCHIVECRSTIQMYERK